MSEQAVTHLHREARQALNRRAYEHAHRCCIEILKRDRGFADAYFLLGMIALDHARVTKALELIDAALAQAPRNTEYLAQRARALVLLKRDSAALEAAKRALDAAPDSALTLDTIGVALSKAGDHETAIEAFSRAVAQAPGNAQFQFNLASSQQFLGRFEAAEQSYEAAIRLEPGFYRAHWALSELRRATPDRNRVARLEALLDETDPDADGLLYVCHALAKEHEDLGHYSTAFEYLQRGKLPKLRAVRMQAADFREIFKSIETVCSAEFVAAGEAGHESSEPIFVVGMPRSGTTLVERILASHEDVFAAGELSEFGLCLKRAAGTGSNRVLDAETVQRAASLSFAELGRDYIESTRPRTGHTPRFVDKLPPNFLYAGFIRRALPKARIICLKRHPMDTCLSNYRQLFSINAPYYNYAFDLLDTGHYYALFDALVKHWQRVMPESFMVVRYESVVENLEREARSLLEFCGLPWDPGVLDFHSHAGPVATASAVQVRNRVYASSIGRWRRYERELEPLRRLLEGYGLGPEIESG